MSRRGATTQRAYHRAVGALLIPLVLALLLASALSKASAEPITRIWLTHSTNDPSALMVNWETVEPRPSQVMFGPTEALGEAREDEAAVTLHHVSIPFPKSGDLHYRVVSGTVESETHRVRSYSDDVLRVALAADWQEYPDLNALMADVPHLLLACGDIVPHVFCPENPRDVTHTRPFSDLIGRYPKLFATVPFMPALGNHDRQILPRVLKPPEEPIYDIDATAFRSFFPLPGDGWKWHFDVPGFDVRFVAVDLNHISDFGTTWQSCHAFDAESAQFVWYRKLMARSTQRFVVTIYNEQHAQVRRQAEGAWGDTIELGTTAVTGFGLFAERSEVNGFPYFNTALKAGDIYSDGNLTKFVKAVPNYILLTIPRGGSAMTVEIKRLDGATLDKTTWKGRG